ncbi:MAG: prephenate dehydratase [Chitinophagales bacterium]
MINKVAIQGFEASFHEAAANKFFGDHISTVECLTFEKLFDVMRKREADVAVMAIENSVAGAILPNYARLRDSNLEVVGEVFIRIEMNLMALKGQTVEEIKEVHSHPIALLQCSKYFRDHPHISVVESNDTALSAKEIADQNIKGRAALASKKAAEIFGLKILAPSIETNKRNFTRFLVLRNRGDVFKSLPKKAVTKASWSFRTGNTPGSLAKILTKLADNQINLTKIQSLPVLGSEWTYYFYADLEFDNETNYQKAKAELDSHTVDLKILGEYAQGEKYL